MIIENNELKGISKEDIINGVLKIPEGIQKIDTIDNWGILSLKDYIEEIVLPDSMIDLEMDSERVDGQDVAGNRNVYIIYNGVFEDYHKIKSIQLSSHTKKIGSRCFRGCKSLENIDIPNEVTTISEEAFLDSGIISLLIPQVKEIERNAFSRCRRLTNIVFSDEINSIPGGRIDVLELDYYYDAYYNATKYVGAFEGCESLENIILPKNLKEMGDCFFKDCKSLHQIQIPEMVTQIGDEVFSGCEALKKVKIPNSVIKIGKLVFKDCLSLISVNIPNENVAEVIAKDFDYTTVSYDEKEGTILSIKENISKENKYIPAPYLVRLIQDKKIEHFISTSDFRAFNSNFDNLKQLLDGTETHKISDEEKFDFFKFAVSLGCFSTEKFLDKNGIPMEATVGQKASALLAQLIKSDKFKIGSFHKLFDSLPLETVANQDFIKFLMPQGKETTNLELLIDMERECPGVFAKVMANFDTVKNYRITVGDNGKNKTVPWRDAIRAYYYNERYEGIDEENRDIALEYSTHSIGQRFFEQAVELRKQAKEKGVPEHILGKELKEKTIMQQIEELKNQTQEELKDTKTIVDELYKKCFTYEWLSKRDPKNGIMGIYTSCCANLKSRSLWKTYC